MTGEDRNKEKQKVMFDRGNIISLHSYLAPLFDRIMKQTSQEETQQTCPEVINTLTIRTQSPFNQGS